MVCKLYLSKAKKKSLWGLEEDRLEGINHKAGGGCGERYQGLSTERWGKLVRGWSEGRLRHRCLAHS